MTTTLRSAPNWNIRTYAQAVKHIEECTCWRGETGDHDWRPISENRKRYLQGRIAPNGDVELRYHQTNVVTVHPDDRITLDLSYPSRSTAAFATALVDDMWVTFDSNYTPAIQTGRMWKFNPETNNYERSDTCFVWSVDPFCVVKHTGERIQVLSGSNPIEQHVLNRTATNKITRAEPYKSFRTWLTAYRNFKPIDADTKKHWWYRTEFKLDAHDILDILADKDRWPEIAEQECRVNVTLEHVREALYGEAKEPLAEVITHPYATSYEQLRQWTRSADRYGYLV